MNEAMRDALIDEVMDVFIDRVINNDELMGLVEQIARNVVVEAVGDDVLTDAAVVDAAEALVGNLNLVAA